MLHSRDFDNRYTDRYIKNMLLISVWNRATLKPLFERGPGSAQDLFLTEAKRYGKTAYAPDPL